jgi:pilus assembly protein CpaB
MPNVTKILAGVLIVLAVLLGLYAWALSRRPAPAPVQQKDAGAENYPVVVAAKPLPAGKPITADELRVASLPINPVGAFAQETPVVGRAPVADIGFDAPITESQLASGLATKVSPGDRAVAIKVDDSNGVGNRVRPGDFIDVFFLLKREGSGLQAGTEVDRSQARLLLSKVRVLAWGVNALSGNEPGAVADGQPALPRVDGARTAVLAVPTEQIDKLALAENAGRLVVALRNPADDETVDDNAFAPLGTVVRPIAANAPAVLAQASTRAAAGVALDDLADVGGGRRPVQRTRITSRGAAGASIEVIRGGRREALAY